MKKNKKINEMCSEAFGYVSNNLVTTQILFWDSRMIFEKIKEKNFGLQNEFLSDFGDVEF